MRVGVGVYVWVRVYACVFLARGCTTAVKTEASRIFLFLRKINLLQYFALSSCKSLLRTRLVGFFYKVFFVSTLCLKNKQTAFCTNIPSTTCFMQHVWHESLPQQGRASPIGYALQPAKRGVDGVLL